MDLEPSENLSLAKYVKFYCISYLVAFNLTKLEIRIEKVTRLFHLYFKVTYSFQEKIAISAPKKVGSANL